MDISVSKESEVPLSKQVSAQIIFQIGVGHLKPGDALPSVRALALRLKIHHNTVSQAYQELVCIGFVTGRRGGRLIVRPPDQPLSRSQRNDLDDLINETIKRARQQGFTIQQLRRRVRERLLEAPPDHLLVVSDEATMRELLRMELTEAQRYPVDACSREDLRANPGLAVSSVILAPPGLMPKAIEFLPKTQPAIPLLYSEAKEHLQMVRQLARPSVIAVVSIDPFFLDMSRGVLGPVVGKRHSLAEYLLTGDRTCSIGAADLVFCDCIAWRHLQAQGKGKTIVPYRLISPRCLEQIASIMADAEAIGGEMRA